MVCITHSLPFALHLTHSLLFCLRHMLMTSLLHTLSHLLSPSFSPLLSDPHAHTLVYMALSLPSSYLSLLFSLIRMLILSLFWCQSHQSHTLFLLLSISFFVSYTCSKFVNLMVSITHSLVLSYLFSPSLAHPTYSYTLSIMASITISLFLLYLSISPPLTFIHMLILCQFDGFNHKL